MPSTLVRYFLKRWGLQILAGFVFFGGLLIAWEVKSISEAIFEQHGSIGKLVPLLLTTIPWNVGLILPMAAVLGGLLGTQHLSEGSELVASQGLGHGMRGFLKPWWLLSLILIACSAINAQWVSPWASRMEFRLFYDLAQDAALAGGYMPKAGEEPKLIRGNIFSSGEGAKGAGPLQEQTVYWGMSKKDGKLHIMQMGSDTVSHLVSDTYSYKIVKVKLDQQDHFEQIRVSFHFEDVSGKAVGRDAEANERFMDMSYKMFEVSQPIQIKKQAFYPPTAMRHLDTGELLAIAGTGGQDARGLAGVELSRRFSTPLACCALLLLGIAIGLSHPRFYRGGALVKSIALILTYIIIVRVSEVWVKNNTVNWIYVSGLLPFLFFAAGWLLLYRKMYPTRHGRKMMANAFPALLAWVRRQDFLARLRGRGRHNLPSTVIVALGRRRGTLKNKVIGRWTSKKWWANFGGVLGIFMLFHVFIEFSNLAPFIAKGEGRIWLFVCYWVCNLPVVMPFLLPVVFLLAWALTFSDAAVSREWTALRAGGVSLVQWICGSWRAWGTAIAAIFLVGAYISPKAYAVQDRYYLQIKGNKGRAAETAARPSAEKLPGTLFLGNTDVFWCSSESGRWGFPLLPPADAPSIIFWEYGHALTRQLGWNGDGWAQGAAAETFFPASPLRQYRKIDEIPTAALFVWQVWAPSPARGTLLWGRLLKWLIGPCLLFAALGYLFPPPRGGRGLALGYALILSLAFLWVQNIFEGAAKAGQLPPLWGVLAPMLIFVGFGLINLRRLHT